MKKEKMLSFSSVWDIMNSMVQIGTVELKADRHFCEEKGENDE